MNITLGHFLGEALILHFSFFVGIIFYNRFNSFFRLILLQLAVAILFYWLTYAIPYFLKNASESVFRSPFITIFYYLFQATLFSLGINKLFKTRRAYWLVLPNFVLLFVGQYFFSGQVNLWQLNGHENNLWVSNLYVLAEMLVLLFALRILDNKALPPKWVQYGFAIFFASFFAHQVFFGINRLVTYPMMIGGLTLVVLYLKYLFILVQGDTRVTGEFWVLTGIALYFAGYSPFFGMFDYLITNHPLLSTKLYITLIQGLLNNLRYVVVGFVFLSLVESPKIVKV